MRPRVLTGAFAVLIVALSFHSRGRAQPADPKPTSPAPSDVTTVVVTGTRTPERSQRAAIRTEVVTREEAERRGATNVAEALTSQPGVQVNPGAYGSLGGVSAIQIQGFDRERVLILEDGERVIGDVGGAIDLATIPLADISRIEIVTGPTSSLYGSSAIGGVVNILTAPPSREGFSAHARGEGRSVPGLFVQGGAAYRHESTWVSAESSYQHMDGIARVPGLPDLTVPETARRLFGLRAGTSLGPSVDVRARVRWIRDRSDGLESQLTPGLGRYLIDLPNVTDRYTAHVITTYDLGRGSNLRVTLGRQWYEGTSNKTYRGSPVDERRGRSYTMQSFEAVSTIADGPRTWVLGTRFEGQRFDQTLTKTTITGGELSTTTEQEVPPVALANGALYGQVAYKLGAWTVLPGVRHELHARYGQAFAPRLAVSWRPSEVVHVRASAGRGFRVPSPKELGFVFDHSIYGYRITGNPDLVPETSWGTNGDVTLHPSRDVVLRAGGFANWVDNLIDVDVEAGVSNGTVTTYTYTNFGKARTAGGQVSAAVRAGGWFRSEVAYDYLWTRDDTTGLPLPARPAHTVTASVLLKLPWQLEANTRWRVTSDTYATEEARSPAYQMLDVRVARPLWPKSQAYAGVLNALDVHQEAGRVGDLRPVMGRVFYLGLRAELPWEDDG